MNIIGCDNSSIKNTILEHTSRIKKNLRIKEIPTIVIDNYYNAYAGINMDDDFNPESFSINLDKIINKSNKLPAVLGIKSSKRQKIIKKYTFEYVIAHEMRHVQQLQNKKLTKEIYDSVPDITRVFNYNSLPWEVDANNYAISYVSKLEKINYVRKN